MTKQISNDRLEVLIQAKLPPALHPLGHEGDCMSCDLVFALRELQERRVEVAKYKAWAASCDPAPPEPTPAQTDEKGRPMTYWGGKANEPAANPSALKCPTCKRPFKEVSIRELLEPTPRHACEHCDCWHDDGDGCCYCSTTERSSPNRSPDP